MTAEPSLAAVAISVDVTGLVQGVGFRPFVRRLAEELGIAGSVGNDSSKVFIEAIGTEASLARFLERLSSEAPPLARIDAITPRAATGRTGAVGFVIVDSKSVVGARTVVSPDVAVCDDCMRECGDPADRRYRHPFITCTNCGPRFTIIRTLPYDRPNTTMSSFPMCAQCRREYDDVDDRRHHAQPIACHDCGPTLRYSAMPQGGTALPTGDTTATQTLQADTPEAGQLVGEAALQAAKAALAGGAIVAVKGIGGFHLVCDARQSRVIERLRDSKFRPEKPFAVMVRSLDAARRLVVLDEVEADELTSYARPIVLARSLHSPQIDELVAPGNPLLGVMLPYTPIHHLLLDGEVACLVMTSANHRGQPIMYRDDAALDGLCDAVLTHDRPIHLPCDDSVVRVVDGHPLPIRRSRGYAPIPVPLPGGTGSVLAVGADLKNTFCVTRDERAWVSQHIGDMEDLETLRAFDASVASYLDMYDLAPDAVVADAHPGYGSTRWAHDHHPDRVVEVQHHHAHIAAVMAEHGIVPSQKVIGVAFDGTGYGADGAIWGGEFLVADGFGFERCAHLRNMQLLGGDAAVSNPYRLALSLLWESGIEWDLALAPVAQSSSDEQRKLRGWLEKGFSCVPTSSMGRLFDAVASLLGLRHRISFEAQAAIDLEMHASGGTIDLGYSFEFDGGVLDPRPMIGAVVGDLAAGVSSADIALSFHLAVARSVATVCSSIRDNQGSDTVVLSGGVFQNALLVGQCRQALANAGGFAVLTHRVVPPNDGGLSLGQAYLGVHGRTRNPPASAASPACPPDLR